MTCYQHGCRQRAAYRLVAIHQTRWRRLLHLGPREWHTCAEHRYDPIALGQALRNRRRRRSTYLAEHP